jgi:hypothetical protein
LLLCALALCVVCSKQVLQLEAILRNRIAQLTVLETENARLKQKEYALQSCILGIENSVAATRAVLAVEAESAGADGNGNTHQSGDTDSQSTASGDVERAAAGTSVSKHSSGSAVSAAQVKSSVMYRVSYTVPARYTPCVTVQRYPR